MPILGDVVLAVVRQLRLACRRWGCPAACILVSLLFSAASFGFGEPGRKGRLLQLARGDAFLLGRRSTRTASTIREIGTCILALDTFT